MRQDLQQISHQPSIVNESVDVIARLRNCQFSPLPQAQSSEPEKATAVSVRSTNPSTPLCTTPIPIHTTSNTSDDTALLRHQPLSRQQLQKKISMERGHRYGFLQTVQDTITCLDRAEIILWMKELIAFHECGNEVYVYAVDLFDRLLSLSPIKKRHLRIAVVACFLIATKVLLDEHEQPLISDLCANCNGEFTINDIKRMETLLLKKFQWQLASTSSVTLMEEIVVYLATDLELIPPSIDDLLLAVSEKYVNCAISYELLRFKSSEIACAIVMMELNSVFAPEIVLSHIAKLHIDTSQVMHCLPLVSRCLRLTINHD